LNERAIDTVVFGARVGVAFPFEFELATAAGQTLLRVDQLRDRSMGWWSTRNAIPGPLFNVSQGPGRPPLIGFLRDDPQGSTSSTSDRSGADVEMDVYAWSVGVSLFLGASAYYILGDRLLSAPRNPGKPDWSGYRHGFVQVNRPVDVPGQPRHPLQWFGSAE
jgi:hypothetical protein